MSFPAYDEYKDSGDDCLGAVPIHWDAKRLRNIMSFSKGLTITKENLQDEGIPCVNYGEIHSKYGFRLNPTVHPLRCVAFDYLSSNSDASLRDGDFVFADTSEDLEGSGNFTHVRADIPLFAGYHTIIGRPREYVFPLFLAFQLHSQFLRSQIQRQVKGIKVFSVSQAVLKSVKCWLPPLDEQKAISSFLDVETSKIDGLVSEQRRLIELLKEKRQAVISHTVTKGLNPNAPMKPSGIQWLGDVPKHWEVAPLKYLSDIKTGFAFKSDEFTDNGVPVLRIGDITMSGTVDFSDAKYLPTSFIDEHEDALVQQHDIVMAMTGATIGKAAKYTQDTPALLNQRVCIFRAFDAAAQPYVWFLLQTSYYAEYLAVTAFGGAQPNISDTELVGVSVPMPPLPERRAIASHLDSEVEKFSKLQAEAERAIELLQERRTALISAAVTGKIDVRGFANKEGVV